MVEDDGAEVTTVVVGNEVFGGVGALQAARSDALVLQQRLVQSKQHLQGETDGKTGRQEGCRYFLHPQTRFPPALRSGGICHEGGEIVRARPVFLFKNVTWP